MRGLFLCTGGTVFRGRQDAVSGYVQEVRYSAEGRTPLAVMHRKCGILREAGMPVAKMHRKCSIPRDAASSR
jgi:hypothetical protein